MSNKIPIANRVYSCDRSCLDFGLDWLTVSAVMPVEDLGDWAARWYGVTWEWLRHGFRWWGLAASGSGGSKLNGANAANELLSAVELPGGIVGRAFTRVRRSLRCLASVDWHATRVDVRWDGSGVSPGLLMAAMRGGRIQSASARFDWRESTDGQTFYWGRDAKGRGDRVLCCYNRRGFNRVEFRAYGPAAAVLGAAAASCGLLEFESQCRGMLMGLLTVDDPEWRHLAGDAVPVRIGRAERFGSRDTNAEWIQRQRKQLAVYVRLNGWDALRSVVDAGGRDLSLRMLSEYGLGVAGKAAYREGA